MCLFSFKSCHFFEGSFSIIPKPMFAIKIRFAAFLKRRGVGGIKTDFSDEGLILKRSPRTAQKLVPSYDAYRKWVRNRWVCLAKIATLICVKRKNILPVLGKSDDSLCFSLQNRLRRVLHSGPESSGVVGSTLRKITTRFRHLWAVKTLFSSACRRLEGDFFQSSVFTLVCQKAVMCN